jgi:hypothetical protein|tara:strand:- start:443 stop:637 length:195 start_codon:yes stop_codon:yes gene_type:complete
MSNNINDMIWEEIWEEITQCELSLDDTHMARVDDIALLNGLHQDDDRDKILNIIAEEMMEERNV